MVRHVFKACHAQEAFQNLDCVLCADIEGLARNSTIVIVILSDEGKWISTFQLFVNWAGVTF